MKKTYEIIHYPLYQKGIKCLTCNKISYNHIDIQQLYCGFCRKYHDDDDESQGEMTDEETKGKKH